MTARVCPVHGEWSETGVCRWCEPKTLLDVALSGPKVRPLPVAEPTPWASKPMHPDVPKGSTPCRCGEYAWAPWCPADEREGVIAGVAHSPEVCVAINATPPSSPSFSFAGEDAIAVRWTLDFTPAICPEDVMAAFEAEVAAQHAALRWERVARRWGAKHRPRTLLEIAVECDRFMDKLIAGYIPKRWP